MPQLVMIVGIATTQVQDLALALGFVGSHEVLLGPPLKPVELNSFTDYHPTLAQLPPAGTQTGFSLLRELDATIARGKRGFAEIQAIEGVTCAQGFHAVTV